MSHQLLRSSFRNTATTIAPEDQELNQNKQSGASASQAHSSHAPKARESQQQLSSKKQNERNPKSKSSKSAGTSAVYNQPINTSQPMMPKSSKPVAAENFLDDIDEDHPWHASRQSFTKPREIHPTPVENTTPQKPIRAEPPLNDLLAKIRKLKQMLHLFARFTIFECA
jgi:hypothetical protein